MLRIQDKHIQFAIHWVRTTVRAKNKSWAFKKKASTKLKYPSQLMVMEGNVLEASSPEY